MNCIVHFRRAYISIYAVTSAIQSYYLFLKSVLAWDELTG